MVPTKDGPSGLHKIRTFTRQHHRPLWVLVVVALAAAMLFPGLGRFGLWDPWEMQRASVARTIAGGARVLVAEPAVAAEGADAPSFPLTDAIRARYPDLGVDGPVELAGERQVRGKTASSAIWTRARAAMEATVYHGIVIDASLLLSAGGQEQSPEQVAAMIDELTVDNDGATIVLYAPTEDIQKQLEDRYALGSVRSGSAMLRTAGLEEAIGAAADTQLAEQMKGDPVFRVTLPIATSTDAAASALSDVPGIQWLRVQHKRDGATWSVPVLDAWLVAGSYRVFGFSEWSSRLPFALVVLFGVLALYLMTRAVLGERVALLSSLAMISMPLAFAAARNLAGDAPFAMSLLLGVGGFLLVIRGGSLAMPLAALAIASVLIFLSKGLFGLLVISSILVAYVAATLDLRRGTLIATFGVLAAFGIALFLVFSPDDWSFFDHFRFMNRLHGKGPGQENRNFDYFIRQIGFGILPWSALLPFALGRLMAGARTYWGTDSREADAESRNVGRVQALVFLWFAVPLVLQMAMLKDFTQIVLPVAPAMAIALGLLLDRLLSEGSLDRFAAVVVGGILLVLIHDIKTSPEPLVSFLAFDPPFTREKSGLLFPDDFKAPGSLMAIFLLSTLILINAFSRLGSVGLRVARFFQRARPLAVTLSVLLTVLGLDLIMSMSGRFSAAFKLPEAARLGADQLAFPAQVLGRPEHVIGGLALAALLIVLIATGTAWGRRRGERASRPVRAIGRLIARGWTLTRLGQPRVGLLALFGLGVLSLIDAVARVRFPEGYGVGSTLVDPAFWALVLATIAAAVLGAGAADPPADDAGRIRRSFPHGRDRWLPAIGAAAALLLYIAVRLSKEAWMTPPELWALLAAAAVIGVGLLGRALASRPGWLLAVIVGGGLAIAGSVLIPYIQKWRELTPQLFPDGEPEDTIRYVFWGARDVRILVALMALLGVSAVWGRRESIGARLLPASPDGLVRRFLGARLVERLLLQLERGRVAIPLFVLCALASSALYAQRFVPDLSFHVSQKHIIDTWREANAGGPEDDLFKHGSFGGASDEYNFYTRGIPEVSDRSRVMQILLHEADVPVKLATEGGHSLIRVVQGFAAANDQNGDGRRDWPGDAGIAETIEDGVLVDEDKRWADNQWAGYLLIDSAGRQLPITSNNSDTLHVQGRPTSGRDDSFRNAYTIDDKDARDHGATAAERGRTFFLLPKLSFSELNFQFRKLSEGRHIPVLDDRSSRIVLAASHLADGEQSRNWIESHVLTDEQLAQVPGIKRTSVNWEDTLELVAWRMERDAVRARDDFKIFLYFKVLKETTTSWRLFMHVDKPGSSNRIGGDHYILNMSNDPEEKGCIGCFQTRHWMPGDIVVDEYSHEVPLGTPGGPQDVWIGFYNTANDKRMKIKDFDRGHVLHDGGNRVRVGTFSVR